MHTCTRHMYIICTYTYCICICTHTHMCMQGYICINIYKYIHVYMFRTYMHTCRVHMYIQGGEDSWDPLRCRSFSTREPLNIGHFCGKWRIKIRDPMSLCHPVLYARKYVREERDWEGQAERGKDFVWKIECAVESRANSTSVRCGMLECRKNVKIVWVGVWMGQ